MTFIKSTEDTVDIVCVCGMVTSYRYSQAVVTPVGVQFPACRECAGNVITGMTIPAFSNNFGQLTEDALKRLIIAQAVRKRALAHSESTIVGAKTREELLAEAKETGRHCFVREAARTYEAPMVPGFKHAREYALEHGKPFIATQVALENSDPELLARVDALLEGSISGDNPQE